MTDYIKYYQQFWDDYEPTEIMDIDNDWWTKDSKFYKKIRQGDSIWVLVLGNHKLGMFPDEWRIRQRILVNRKTKQPNLLRPYRFIGDSKKSETFDILGQKDATPTLHSLRFATAKKIPTSVSKAKLGQHFQSFRALTHQDVHKLRKHVVPDFVDSVIKHMEAAVSGLQKEDAHVRLIKKAEMIIRPEHKKLANKLRLWLEKREFKVTSEKNRLDIEFVKGSNRGIAELKICTLGTTRAIREAIGQLLEYSLYPKRIFPDTLLIVLNKVPSNSDLKYVEILRDHLKLPLGICWYDGKDFVNVNF